MGTTTVRAIGFAAAFLLFGGTARVMAQDDCAGPGCPCSDDGSCGEGFLCQPIGVGACDAAPPCADGMECPKPEDYSCDPELILGCVPEPCDEDSDCGDGYVCQEVGRYADCVTSNCEGEDCPPPDCDESTPVMDCVPAPCDDDADCGEGLKCLTVQYDRCDKPAICAEEGGMASCDDPDPATCELVIEGYCAPPYVGPCEADADCGEGFNCVEAQLCSCSGGGRGEPTPADGGGGMDEPGTPDESDPTDPPECECEPGGEFYCEMQQIECEDAEDCPSGWSCPESYAMGRPCYAGEDGTEECAPEPVRICTPPGWGYGWAADSSGVVPVLNAATGAENARAAAPEEPGSGPGADGTTGGGGCSAAPSATGSSAWALIGLASLLMVARRRRRSR